MAISPMFRERFQQALYDKLESVHRHQTTTTSIDQTSLLQQNQQQQQQQPQPSQSTPDLVEQALSQDVFNDLQNWIH